jgi:hypothetical protein
VTLSAASKLTGHLHSRQAAAIAASTATTPSGGGPAGAETAGGPGAGSDRHAAIHAAMPREASSASP